MNKFIASGSELKIGSLYRLCLPHGVLVIFDTQFGEVYRGDGTILLLLEKKKLDRLTTRDALYYELCFLESNKKLSFQLFEDQEAIKFELIE